MVGDVEHVLDVMVGVLLEGRLDPAEVRADLLRDVEHHSLEQDEVRFRNVFQAASLSNS